MAEYNQLTSPEKKVEWANRLLEKLESLTANEGNEVKITFYFRDGKRVRSEYTVLKDNLKSIVDYINQLRTNDLIKPLSAGVEATYLIYFASDIKKPFKEVTREDIERFLKNKKRNKKDKSEAYKMMFKNLIKTFFRWVYNYEKEDGYPEVVKWINTKRNNNSKMPEILTMEEIQKMIEVCDNFRDRALISVLYESGCRDSEILGIKIKDLQFDEYGIKIMVDGKTGQRIIRFVSSVTDLKAWLNVHPRKDDKNASLFCSLSRNNKGDPLGCSSSAFILYNIANKAGIERRVYPHLFRHTRATHLAKSLTEQELKVYFGWTKSSTMAGIYVHLSGKDIDDKILQVNGIKQKDGTDAPKIPTIKCPNSMCGEINSIGNKFCQKCYQPLQVKEITEDEKTKEFILALLPGLIERSKEEKSTEELEKLVKLINPKKEK